MNSSGIRPISAAFAHSCVGHFGKEEWRWWGALCVLIYLPAKLSPEGLTSSEAYVPHYTWSRYIGNTGVYLADLLYRSNPHVPLGVTPFTPLKVGLVFAVLIAIALWMRSRPVWFGLCSS